MKCQNDACGADLPLNPREAIERDELDEVVAHINGGEEDFIASQTDYYCDAECFSEAQ
jgi:hypothetical protein